MDYSDMDEDDARFLTLVEAGEIELFGHREHLRLAWLAARATGSLDETVERCRAGIRAVAAAKGAPDRYDEAVTTDWAARMRGAVAALPDASFDELLEQHPALVRRA